MSKLKVRSCFIDGEAIVVDERGLSAFDLLGSWRHDHAAALCAFDLIELDGKDLRRVPIEQRKRDGIDQLTIGPQTFTDLGRQRVV